MNDTELILVYLADNDYPCPYCQYNLRAIREPLCPECGEILALHPDAICLARATDRRILSPTRGLFRTAIIGLAIPIVAFLIMGIAIATRWPGVGQLGILNIIAFVGLVVHPALLFLLIWNRRRFIRLSPRWSYVLALGSWYWAMIPAIAICVMTLWNIALAEYV
ncbi:MAG: hypothetical protein KDA31_05830 [Phycisphaerales bacterium]|nr:hypothetical protein [Phycisphaerales bacterium]MCB9835861.1 hypothetical protein [Phycisphaera sp.]